MTNDINTLNGALQELGETIADNLVSMGVVDADASDGLTTLAGKILTIEPSIGGLDLDTAITLTSSSASITLGGSVVLTSKLTASYDDETLVNVDLEGVLTGATVSFMNGNTVIGTDVTDSNGVATYTYTPAASGTLSLKAVFAGTDNFDDCESSAVTVSVIAVPDSISLSADKSVLSYYDSESATLSATVLDSNSQPCEGETVEFFKGSTSLGTATTNASGVATKSYSSTGAGDVTFTAEVGSLVSEPYSIEDCIYYNSAEVTRSTTNGSTIYDSDMSVALPTNCEISFDTWSNNSKTDGEHRFFLLPKSQYSSGTTQPSYAIYYDYYKNLGKFGKRENGSSIGVTNNESTTMEEYHTIKLVKDGTSVGFYVDNVLKTTQTLSWIDNYTNYTFSMIRWSTSGTSKLRNVKIKPL